MVLPQPEYVVVPSRKVTDVQRDMEVNYFVFLPLRYEPLGDSTLIEDLNCARVQTTRARADEVVCVTPLRTPPSRSLTSISVVEPHRAADRRPRDPCP